MDPSMGQADDGSDSPTQVNEGRSYDQYTEDPASLSLTGIRQTQEQTGFSDDFLARSLHENESGAVNFNSLYSGGAEIESPMAREGQSGRRRSSGTAPFSTHSDNDPVATTVGLEPETPAAPKNPFAGKFQTPLVAGSQLFAQTPFSAAFGQASPTSSRPSPSDLPVQTAMTPHTGGSSLLRPRFPNSIRDELQTPMPMPMFHNLTTSSQSRPETITPYHGEPTAPATLQQPSSPTARRRRMPAPIQEYEPMKKSQERREAATGSRPRLGSFNSSSDDDADTASQRRRAIVHQNKQEATKILSAISMSGPTFRDDIVEVPASTRKEERPRSRGKESSFMALGVCPESDPQDAVTESTPTATVKPFDGPRSSVPESEYGHLSFPQSMIDAEYGTKTLPATKTPSSSAISLPDISETVRKQPRHALHPHSSINEADAIPETSPARIRASATMQSPIHITSDAAEAPSIPPSADSDLLSSQPRLDPPSPTRPRQSQHDSISQVIGLLKQEAHRETHQDKNAVELATSSPPVPLPEAFNSKKRQRKDDKRDTGNRRPAVAASTSSGRSAGSSLSSLSVTPTQASRAGTPITANDSDRSTRTSDKKDGVPEAPVIPGIDVIDIRDDSPPLPQRRRRHDILSLPTMKHDASTYTKKAASATTMKRGLSPFPSGSTDELAVSPASFATGSERRTRSTRTFARSASSRNAALASTSHRRESTAPGLFSGMLFSVTFQSKRKGESDADYSKREKQGEKLQARILDEGGSILPDGFDALFQSPQITTPPVPSTGTFSSRYRADLDTANKATSGLRLLPHATGTGFTALISDGHSRKAKYMQALALGLPCLAPRWVTACLERNELVDWTSYLLCAGESSFLGGAIRSRNLASYNAYTAQLVDVVESRSKLLEGLNILVFVRRSTREAYIFLAHVLGASLSRAHSPQEAREYLRAMEDAGRPFDWVYTDDEADINSIFQDRASRPAAKRRKRPSSTLATHNDTDRPPAPVKLLSDERFIQSLIFGKLIEEDDLGD
ncbi:hypothetical protein F503_08228 [Ophiostoma piceae UAMH 11346]|uniref:BRCT domain-containing protein n=1 Tax=Ophiostoma piceae (strain UAMH 11346) TaxID=1262450 RepID=S3BYW3_OPHP1|nr:hypothetical protein F503_08228 [Ophiostoma piceae UAMH 11346]